MLKVNNKDTRTTPLATYFTACSSVSIVNFEQVDANWVNLQFYFALLSQLWTGSFFNRLSLAYKDIL